MADTSCFRGRLAEEHGAVLEPLGLLDAQAQGVEVEIDTLQAAHLAGTPARSTASDTQARSMVAATLDPGVGGVAAAASTAASKRRTWVRGTSRGRRAGWETLDHQQALADGVVLLREELQEVMELGELTVERGGADCGSETCVDVKIRTTVQA